MEDSSHAQLSNSMSTDIMNKECPITALLTSSVHANIYSQTELTGSRKETMQDDGAHETTNSVDAFTILLNSLQAGQNR